MVQVFFIVLLLLISRPLFAGDKVYTFAVVPQQSLSELADIWIPFVDWLSSKSGVKLRFVTAPTIPAFEQKLSQDAYDIAYMNPYHYVVFHEKPGYQALAKERGRKIKGLIVVRKDSNLSDIKELDGATLTFPSSAAFAASILPRAALRQAGVHFASRFVASHESVYLNVAQGKYLAGGGVNRTFYMLDDQVREQLRILWITPEYTPHAIATRSDMPNDVLRALSQALMSMNDDPIGQQHLKKVGLVGLESAKDSDWNDVRELNISTDESGLQ